MPKYILGHHLKGEGARLDLMSELLDLMHRRYIDALDVVKPGARTLGALLLIEPDLLPLSVAEPSARALWDGWLAWSRERGIDYHIGRSIAPSTRVALPNKHQWHSGNRGLQRRFIAADYWTDAITELRSDLISSGKIDEALIDKFLVHCADSTWWTQTIAFTAVHGRSSCG
jgi:hypothetical protein